jgi:D-arabinose 5-phosphate isomerase GutQ
MKRSALAGLFITAAMLASPVFAAGDKDLCEINLNKINNGKALLATDSSGKSGEIDTAVSQAKAAHAAGDEKKCIEITTKALQDLQDLDKGGK